MTVGINRDFDCSFAQSASHGFKMGATKLKLAMRGASLLLCSQTHETIEDNIQRIAELSQKLEEHVAKNDTLRGSFSRSAKRILGKTASFLGEYSAVFGATAVGGITGPWGGVIGASAVTFPQALGAAFLQEIENAGYDLKDPDQIVWAFSDKDLMKVAKRNAYIHTAHMTTGVALAGALAGYLHHVASQSIASAGTSTMRSVMPAVAETVMPKVAERSAIIFGDALAQGARLTVNGVSKGAIGRLPVKALFVSAAVTSAAMATQGQQRHESARGIPDYHLTRMYL